MSWEDADQRQWNRSHDHQWRQKRPEPSDDQYIDENEYCCKGQAKITEHFHRDMPLTIPLHGKAIGAFGHRCSFVLFDGVTVGHLDLVDRIAHFADGIYRAFF